MAGYYRRFIQGFSQVAAPLFALLKKQEAWAWNDKCREAFETVRQMLCCAPVLALPRFEIPFELSADASDSGLGAVLSQSVNGRQHVIGYASRTLHQHEKNYAVIEKEALALVWAMGYFRCYLYGRPFVLRTDHKPLVWLKSVKKPSGRLARWLAVLSECEYIMQYTPGKDNVTADALSRLPVTSVQEGSAIDRVEERLERVMLPHQLNSVGFVPEWNREDLARLQREDSSLSSVISYLETQPNSPPKHWSKDPNMRSYWRVWKQLSLIDGVLHRERYSIMPGGERQQKQVVVAPRVLVSKILEQSHDQSGHMGLEKTVSKIESSVWWPGYTSDTADWIRCCESCARRKSPAVNPRAPLISVPIGAPMEMLALDILGPLPESNGGNKYLPVVADYFTKWPEVFAIKDQKATTVARVLFDEVVSRFGVPLILHSDQGRNFESAIIKELCALLGVKKSRTTPYHPQSDGLVERLNRTLLDLLAKHVEERQRDWDEWISTVLFAYRTAKHASTGESPFKLMFGRESRTPLDVMLGKDEPPSLTTEYVSTLKEAQLKMCEKVEECLVQAQSRQQDGYNALKIISRDYQPRDLVWLYTPVQKQGTTRKLGKPWKGPYRVIRKRSPVLYDVRLVKGGPVKRVHHNRLKPCYRRPETGLEETSTGEVQIAGEAAQPRSFSDHDSQGKEVLAPPAIQSLGEDIVVVVLPNLEADTDFQQAPDPAPPEPDLHLPVPPRPFRTRTQPAWMQDYETH